MIALENKTYVLAVQLRASFTVQLVYGFFQQEVVAAPAIVEQADDAQQRGFPGPRWPHDGDKFTFFYLQTDAAKQPDGACRTLDGLFNIRELNHELNCVGVGNSVLVQSS